MQRKKCEQYREAARKGIFTCSSGGERPFSHALCDWLAGWLSGAASMLFYLPGSRGILR